MTVPVVSDHMTVPVMIDISHSSCRQIFIYLEFVQIIIVW